MLQKMSFTELSTFVTMDDLVIFHELQDIEDDASKESIPPNKPK